MGIDIFLMWDGIEKRAQDDKIEHFSITSGHLGYLRESYSGAPYATQILVREAFESRTCKCRIPAAKMRARLTKKSKAARNCNGGHAIAMAIAAAVQHSPVKNPHEMQTLLNELNKTGIEAPECVTPEMTVEDAVREYYTAPMYAHMSKEDVERVVQSFRDFVDLAERREKEMGKPCMVVADY
jgi:hypothetical protein